MDDKEGLCRDGVTGNFDPADVDPDLSRGEMLPFLLDDCDDAGLEWFGSLVRIFVFGTGLELKIETALAADCAIETVMVEPQTTGVWFT